MTRTFAWMALALGTLASFAGSPYLSRVDVAQLAAAVAREEDHVTALELAQWIKDRKPGLRVIDVRSQADFEAYHVPTAERVALESIPAAPFAIAETIVLYSDGGAHAAQAWVFLRALGYKDVYFLRGGLYDWLDEVMSPTIAADASADAKAAFARAAELSRYFGGTPSVSDEKGSADARVRPGLPPPPPSTSTAVARIKRRRC